MGSRWILRSAHTAYGRIGDFGGGGGVEIIGFDGTSGDYISYFFDSQGNVTTSTLVRRDDTWSYQGESTRSTVEFGASNHAQTVVHERPNDGQSYTVSMKVTLKCVEVTELQPTSSDDGRLGLRQIDDASNSWSTTANSDAEPTVATDNQKGFR